jgi:hypothetical protein
LPPDFSKLITLEVHQSDDHGTVRSSVALPGAARWNRSYDRSRPGRTFRRRPPRPR